MNNSRKKMVGFNFLWMFSQYSPDMRAQNPALNELDFIAEQGFNFVRIPTDYRFWLKKGTGKSLYDTDIPAEELFEPSALELIDSYIDACSSRGLHANLNIHRAPGYCINSPEWESRCLWTDADAQERFLDIWRMFARRYSMVSPDKLSFDLINEPCNLNEKFPCTISSYASLMRRTAAAIREITPDRVIAVDGFDGGGTAVPELADLGAVMSGRGYEPFRLTHYRASWVHGSDKWEAPSYPGYVAPGEYKDINTLRKFYRPWRDLEAAGAVVHIGECGCYNKVVNETALRWFADFVAVMNENGWGYALWNFNGDFGIVSHGRPGTEYIKIDGLNVDRAMLDIMKTSLK